MYFPDQVLFNLYIWTGLEFHKATRSFLALQNQKKQIRVAITIIVAYSIDLRMEIL